MNYFKGQTVQFKLIPQVGNHNLKPREETKVTAENEGLIPPQETQPQAYMNKEDARQRQRVVLTQMYNKVVLLHLNPNMGKIFVYELDPTFIYRF